MNTSAAIAVWTNKDKNEWAGRIHYLDGTPSGLGASLYQLVRDETLGDLATTLRVLIHDHPAGWHMITRANWRQRPGYQKVDKERHPFDYDFEKRRRPQCYCHRDRHEEPWELTQLDAAKAGAEWSYVFDARRRTMSVLEAVADGRHARRGLTLTEMLAGQPRSVQITGCNADATFLERAVVFLDNPEPDWETLEG